MNKSSVGARRPRRLRPWLAKGAAVAALGAATAAGAGLLAGEAASAATTGATGYFNPVYNTFNAANSSLAIDVSGASTAAGAPIIQWYDNGGNNQHWAVASDDQTGPIVNQNNGMCLTTDGVAGDQLTQMPCDGSGGQEWMTQITAGYSCTFYNPAYGLQVDVYGASQWAGAAIDAWYPNGNDNQTFINEGYEG